MGIDLIIIPMHLGAHWACAMIDSVANELVYYDLLVYQGSLSVRTSFFAS